MMVLPRGYLSYSQKELWKKDRPEYERIYFYGGKSRRNKYMDFGSEVADDGENDTSQRETIKALNALLPTYQRVEHKIDTAVRTAHGILRLYGRLDTFEDKPLRFRERKTGTVPWTHARVKRHEQIDFYYMLIYLSSGRMPDEAAWLDWAETRVNDNGDIELTGENKEYRAERTLVDVLRMINSTTEVAKQIADAYEAKLMAV